MSEAGGIPVSKGDAERGSVSKGNQVHMLCDVWRRQVFWNIKGMGELTVFLVEIFLWIRNTILKW